MYNTVLGALPLNQYGKAFYQSSYQSHAHKGYFDGYGNTMEDEWPCCSGTLPQIAADYRISAYFRDEQALFVNLYLPSTLRWQHCGAEFSLSQSGAYPLGDSIAFEINTSRPTSYAIRLRIPAWAQNPSISVNGTRLAQSVRAGSFATVRREWKTGDRIELKLPGKLELKAIDATHPDTVALCYGPLVLFALSEDTPVVTRDALLAARQQSQDATEWHVDAGNDRLRFVPFWAIKDETYFTYLSV